MKQIRLLIIDKHTAVRRALAVRLQSSLDIDVIGTARDLTESESQNLNRVDVALLGLSSNDEGELRGTVATVKRLAQQGTAVLALTPFADEVARENILRAGASCYLLKDINTPQLLAEIRRVAAEKDSD